MSVRQQLNETHKNRTVAQTNVRALQESKAFVLGVPLSPDQYAYNNRPLWAIWKRYSKFLLDKRLLSYADGDALLSLCKAELNGQKEIKAKILNETWQQRKPFPEPVNAGDLLTQFIATISDERASFPQRLIPGETVTLDSDGGRYEFPDGDAATIARDYARAALSSSDTGDLIKRAAARFLGDLENGSARGSFFDPVAVRNVVHFMKVFGGLENILPWEIWIVAGIFGFKRASGLRLITEAHVSMGRKNGKTRLAASLGLFLLVCDLEKYAEVYICSTAKEQSRICWRDAKRVVGDNAELAEHVTRWAGELNVKSTDSKMQALASEERSFLGVRASGIICDELGVWTDRNAYDAIVQSTVSRQQPLTISITTAPATRMSFCHEKFAWCEKILRSVVQADHIFAAIYRIDDSDDPKDIVALRKANPSLGTILPEEHIKKQIAELDDMPSGMNNFLQFHCNVTPENSLTRQGSISAKQWDACSGLTLIGETDPEKAITKFLLLNTDTPCYVGIDIGMSSDTTAIAMFFPKARFAAGAEPIRRPTVVVQVFQPEIGILEKERIWQVPLSTWARTGFLTLMPGDLCDLREIKKYIIDLHQHFRIRECGFDPWSFPTQAAELNEMGITCVAIPQVPSQLTAPIQELLSAIHTGELVHFGSPMLSWMAGNVVFAESERHAGLKPEKIAPNEKIDGIAALLNAWHRMLGAPPEWSGKMYFFGDGATAAESDGKGGIVPMPPLTKQPN
jgi:phage terminase large subunit-like protein